MLLLTPMAPSYAAGGPPSLVSRVVDPYPDGPAADAAADRTEDDGAAVADAAPVVVAGDSPEVDRDTETDSERKQRFTRAIEEYMSPLYGNALRLTGNPHDASDLVQVTFERAFKAFHQYQPGTNLKAWLFKIQSNAFINDYRKRQRQPRIADSDTVEDWQMHRAESHASTGLRSAEAEVLESLPDQAIRDALDQLSPEYRQAVLLADVEGYKYKDIADIMGTPIGTVMSRLHRGRRQLRELLAEHARRTGYLRGPEDGEDAS